jgi:hypothetical protein
MSDELERAGFEVNLTGLNSKDIVRHCSSLSPEQNRKKFGNRMHETESGVI